MLGSSGQGVFKDQGLWRGEPFVQAQVHSLVHVRRLHSRTTQVARPTESPGLEKQNQNKIESLFGHLRCSVMGSHVFHYHFWS